MSADQSSGASYIPVPAPKDAPGPEVQKLLQDLARRKEFAALAESPAPDHRDHHWRGFGGKGPLSLSGFRLSGAQQFVRGFASPNTPYKRNILNWQTGVGKTPALITITSEFEREYHRRATLGERAPAIFIIGFTAQIVQDEMLKWPEFGIASASEIETLTRLRAAAAARGPASAEARQLSGVLGALRRRITDRTRGGYYQFYGYKAFANRLLRVTRRGAERGFDVASLYKRRAEDADDEITGGARARVPHRAEPVRVGFGARLAKAVADGLVTVDTALLDELRGGFLACDEFHNTYNISAPNNYGIAIQYALDALGDEAPRFLGLSATLLTGSAAEIVDVLNALVQLSELPGGVPLRRSDFFTGSTSGGLRGASGPPKSTLALREGALERIAALAAGRISFLLDADVGSYPRRVFVGEDVPGVPYLKLTLCPMSPFHEATLAHALAERAAASAGQGGDTGAATGSLESATGSLESATGSLESATGLPPDAYTLYDMAFPNPQFTAEENVAGVSSGVGSGIYGLYRSGETPSALAKAPAEWRAAVGVVVERGATTSAAPIIAGPFLGPTRIQVYSEKYRRTGELAVAAVRGGPGTIMIFHPRVRMSGVLAIAEVLRQYGFADENSPPTDATICAICGVPRGEHSAVININAAGLVATTPHPYAPARFIVAHSDIDRAVMLASIRRFNALDNIRGARYRVAICSRVVREGYNFHWIRYQIFDALPTDYPTWIQVAGRASRKDQSHAALPMEEREVKTYVLVSTYSDGRISPELHRYINKGNAFLLIQKVEVAIRMYAVDMFVNGARIRAAMRGPGADFNELGTKPRAELGADSNELGADFNASLSGLPFEPRAPPAAPPGSVTTATFDAYGFNQREVALVASALRCLFGARPVWTYADALEALRAGAVRRLGYNPAYVDEGNFALALATLARPFGDPPTAVIAAGRFFVQARIGADGRPLIGPESYLREPATPPPVVVRLADYLRGSRAGANFEVRLRAFEGRFLRGGSKTSAPETAPHLALALVEYDAAFHTELLRRLVMSDANAAVTSDDKRVIDLYHRFKIIVTLADAKSVSSFRGGRSGRGSAARPVGYATADVVSLYDGQRWYSAPPADFGIGRRHRENNIVVGFVASADTASGAPDAGAALAGAARFKIRLPVARLKAAHGDVRTLARGAVCETRPREELRAFASGLHAMVTRLGVRRGGVDAAAMAEVEPHEKETTVPPGLSELAIPDMKLVAEAAYDLAAAQRFPSAGSLCDVIRINLLALEEAAREPDNGMTEGLRWLYLFSDRPPTISAIGGSGTSIWA